MANEFEDRIRVILESVGANRTAKDIDTVKRSILGMNTEGRRFTKKMKDVAFSMKTVRRESTRFKAEWLGIMFAGMQVQRLFGGMFKTLIKDYREFTKEATTPLANSLTRLEANWKFLKFAIVEAAGPFLITIADFLGSMAQSIAKMDPKVLATAMGAIGGLGLIGGLAYTLGQGMLLINSITLLKNSKATVDAVQAMAGLSSSSLDSGTRFLDSLGKAAGYGAIAFSVVEGANAFKNISEGKWAEALFDALSSGLLAAGGYKLIKGTGGGWLLALGVAVELAEQGVIGKALASIVGTIAGLGSGIAAAVTKAIAEYKNTVKSLIGNNPILSIIFGTGIGSVKLNENEMRALGQSYSEAFGEGFKFGFAPVFQTGKNLDSLIAEAKEAGTFNTNTGALQLDAASIALSADNMALLEEKTRSANALVFGVNETFKKDLPSATEEFITSKEKGLQGILDKVNEQLDAARNLTAELSKPVVKTVTIKYREEGNSSRAANAGII